MKDVKTHAHNIHLNDANHTCWGRLIENIRIYQIEYGDMPADILHVIIHNLTCWSHSIGHSLPQGCNMNDVKNHANNMHLNSANPPTCWGHLIENSSLNVLRS